MLEVANTLSTARLSSRTTAKSENSRKAASNSRTGAHYLRTSLYFVQGQSDFITSWVSLATTDSLFRLSDPRHTLRSIVGDELATNAKDVWGLDEEGELKGCYGDSGLEGMWNIMGTFHLIKILTWLTCAISR